MSTFYQEVLRKPEKTNYGKSIPRPSGVKHYANPSSFLRNFSGFLVNDEHNASNSICRDEPKSPSESNHQGILCYRLFEFMAKIAEILCNAKFFVMFLY